MKPRLPHQRQKTDRFERNRLTTRIWTGDDKQIKILPQPDIDRHHFFLIKKRMPTLSDIDPMLRIKKRSCGI